MNVANLQLEGLIMAVAAVNKLLVSKGLLTEDEVETALHGVEASLTGDERLAEDMSPAQRDAVCFPVRLMRLVNAKLVSEGLAPGGRLIVEGLQKIRPGIPVTVVEPSAAPTGAPAGGAPAAAN